jgi:hypothetical protein
VLVVECVGSVDEAVEDEREPGALLWGAGSFDLVPDAQVAGGVHVVEFALGRYPAGGDPGGFWWLGEGVDVSQSAPPSGADVPSDGDRAVACPDLVAAIEGSAPVQIRVTARG